MKTSICIATYDKPKPLMRTVYSILRQDPGFAYEVIVVDDGSPTHEIYHNMMLLSADSRVKFRRIERSPGYRNPAVARNVAYRMATGDVVICQSDDVIHVGPNTVKDLTEELCEGTFCIATVINVDTDGNAYSNPHGTGYGDKLQVYTSPQKPRPLMFLGSLWRKDLYAVGGNDEEFIAPSGEDRWFATCLMHGLGLRPKYLANVVGHHQAHQHCNPKLITPSQELIRHKIQQATRAHSPSAWVACGGPWRYNPTPS